MRNNFFNLIFFKVFQRRVIKMCQIPKVKDKWHESDSYISGRSSPLHLVSFPSKHMEGETK